MGDATNDPAPDLPELQGSAVAISRTDAATPLVLAICHEAGNLIGAIRLNAHLLDDGYSPLELATASVDIDDLSARIGSLLSLVRPLIAVGVEEKGEGSLPANVIAGVREAVEAEGGRGVSLTVEPCEELPGIVGEPETLHQLIVLFVHYAVDDARVDKTGSVQAEVRVRAESVGPAEVCFTIEDTGPGDSELESWPGRPLRGRVLACAITDSVLKRLGGRLHVSRTAGVTRLALTLPVLS